MTRLAGWMVGAGEIAIVVDDRADTAVTARHFALFKLERSIGKNVSSDLELAALNDEDRDSPLVSAGGERHNSVRRPDSH